MKLSVSTVDPEPCLRTFSKTLEVARLGPTGPQCTPASGRGGGEEVSGSLGLRAGGLAHASPFLGAVAVRGQAARGGSTCGPAHAAAISCPHGAAAPPPRATEPRARHASV